MASREEEQALIALIQARNSAAEEKFFADFRLWIQQEIRRRRVAEADAEDIAQQVLFAAFRQLRQGQFQGHSSLKTWLQKIVHGKVVDYWRQQPRGQVVSLPAPLEDGNDALQIELVQSLLAHKVDPGLIIAVREVLRRMPEPLRYVLLLQRLGGYTIQEISRSLALTHGQVASKLYKAEELFRQLLAETNDEKLLPQKHSKSAAHGLLGITSLLLRTGAPLAGGMTWPTHRSQPNKQAVLPLRLASW